MSISASAPVVVDVLGATEPHLADPTAPLIFADDVAAIRGDGVFETMMLRQGKVRNLQRHRDRFRTSAAMLDLPQPDESRWLRATELASEMAKKAHWTEAALRWVYSRGRESTGAPTGWITVTPVGEEVLRARREGVRVMTAERGFRLDLSERSPWALIGAKTLSYAANMAVLRAARARGYDDAIFVSEEGNILEGPTSSVVVVDVNEQGEKLMRTPAHDAGILPGTSQASLFALAQQQGWRTQQCALRVPDLVSAAGVWLVSSVRIQARVTAIDGVELPRPAVADEVEELATRAVAGY